MTSFAVAPFVNMRDMAQKATSAVTERLSRKRAAETEASPTASPVAKRLRSWLVAPMLAASSGYKKFITFAAAARFRRAVGNVAEAKAPEEVKQIVQEVEVVKCVKEVAEPNKKFAEPIKVQPDEKEILAHKDDSCTSSESEM